MGKELRMKLVLELVWWVLTAFVVYLVMRPIYESMHVWRFWKWNTLFIVVLITFARYTFLLKYTFLARLQIAKGVIILAMFPIVFSLVNGMNIFMAYIEDFTWQPITGHLPEGRKQAIESYLWNEMIFFGAGSVISSPVLAVRLFISIWRQHNRGTV